MEADSEPSSTGEPRIADVVDMSSSMRLRSTLRLRCATCGGLAEARTPHGVLCLRHAVAEFLADYEQGSADWVPKLLDRPRWRDGVRPQRTFAV